MSATEVHKPERIEKVLIASGGVISFAAEILKCSHTTIHNYLGKYPELKELRETIKEENIDIIENKLIVKAKAGDNACMMFYLKCQAKHRGYIERQEITGKNGNPIESHLQIDIGMKQLQERKLEVLASLKEIKMLKSGDTYIAEETKAAAKPKKKGIKRRLISKKNK